MSTLIGLFLNIRNIKMLQVIFFLEKIDKYFYLCYT